MNRKRDRAIRARMKLTGEPYSVAARHVDEAHAVELPPAGPPIDETRS